MAQKQKYKLLDGGKSEKSRKKSASGKDAAPYQLSVETPPPIGKSYWGTGHTACISDFYQSLRDNRRFHLNLETMEPSIRLMLGTYESARSGHSVTLIEQ